ncbi:hypothetical protein BGX38DRAFT_1278928 [Terfezia claveryi]|nr:hypothetical protein BGX38DRAFT_1278928 [Terfezia claveryi]
MSTEIVNIAGKLVKRSQGLRERYRNELAKLDGPERWELALEVARLTQEQTEQISFAAQVQKEVIEAWTDEDYAAMQVDRVTADAKLGFTSIILPLADIHSESERRKGKAKDRLEATWGAQWEDQVGDLMPPWPAEEFLRELAVFSEKQVDWAAAKLILEARVKERLAAKKTKKVAWLTSRDIADRAISERRKARGKKAVAGSQPETDVGENSAGRITPVGENSAGRITLTLLSPSQLSSSSVSEAAAQDPNVDLENIDKELPGSEPVVETQRSIPHGSSASPPKEAEAESGAEPRLSEEVRMDKGKGRAVDAGEAKEAEAAPKTRKRKRAANEVEKSTVEKRRKYGLEIPIINLDVEEGVEELKREALDEEEKDEALAVEEAVKVLFRGNGWPDKETAGRMLRKMMKVMKAEVVEVDDD